MNSLKPRIFISSVMSGYSSIRQTAVNAVKSADCEAIYAENFPATENSPRTACLDGVASCDGIVLILGARYGDVTRSGKSATEEEYLEAVKRNINIYIFLEKVETEPKQDVFIKEIENYISGHWRKTFTSKEELLQLINKSLQEYKPMISTGNEEDSASKKIDHIFTARPSEIQGIVWLRLASVSLRNEEVIEPIQFALDDFQKSLQRIAHGGVHALLSYGEANKISAQANGIQLEQGDATNWRGKRDLVEINIAKDGQLAITLNITGLETRQDLGEMYFIEPEMVLRRIEQAWEFTRDWWNSIDPYLRHSALMLNVALYDIGTRRLEKLPNNLTSITVPNECPCNPLLIFDGARKVTRNQLNSSEEIIKLLKMISLRFQEFE